MKRSLLALAIPFVSLVCIAQDSLVQTANRFINTLTIVQQKKVQYSFTDQERFNCDLKHDFGTDELAAHYYKEHGAGRQDQNTAYAQQ